MCAFVCMCIIIIIIIAICLKEIKWGMGMLEKNIGGVDGGKRRK